MTDKKCSCSNREFFPAKARFEENGFEHIISFMPGFTCERFLADKNDGGNHGIACVNILWLVRNEYGAVQFSLLSGWYPDWQNSKTSPLPSDLGYHSPIPQYENQSEMQKECFWLNNKLCYYDGSTLNAEKPFNILIQKGESALWNFLEQYHKDIFSPSPNKE